MSLETQLANKTGELGHVDRAISEIVGGISVSDIMNDPAFAPPVTAHARAENDTQNLTLYQLNAKIKDLEDVGNQLNELWLVKNLIHEVESALDSEDFWDKDELSSVVKNLEKLHEKSAKASSMNLAISASIKEKFDNLSQDVGQKLARIFQRFISASAVEYSVYETLKTGEKSLQFDEFFNAASSFETLHPSSRVFELLASLKTDWESAILDPFISKTCLLSLKIHDAQHVLEMLQTEESTGFSMDAFLHSLQCFVHFVNATHLRPLKNYFSTKISNGLADTISENISYFIDDTEDLTQKLLQTLDLLSASGWTVPLRNIFTANSNIRETLRGLHLNWITDKYIDELRTVFASPEFDQDLQKVRTETQTVEVQPPVTHESQEKGQFLDANVPEHTPSDAVSEEIDWDEDWGSDDNDEKTTKASVHSDAWDENWDESWSDEDRPKGPEKPVLKAKNRTEDAHIAVAATPQNHTETYSLVLSALPEKITNILSEFERETGGADQQTLLDTVFCLALASYPPVSQSFLMFNDLKSIECTSQYLKECVDTEWKHFCQSFSSDVAKTLKSGSLGSGSDDPGNNGDFESVGQIKTLMDGLVESALHSTNAYELKQYVLQVLNLTNRVVLQKILGCKEITEYQSEEFTRYLENLQDLEADILARFNEETSALTTTNKVMQTKFLINNHLKSIMEYFYQGELYDFSTAELVSVIKSVFIPSELRENCVAEIMDVRNS